ncbi:ATP-dependent DNA helicase DinG [Chengkuizengella axinellae]|uniref:3'-5' exonuclease DinG n=1 Tax=Chengkuizengella axinellae TaxID=3064388 RepID=A0ABT9IYE8_9BACL|nr:ATP-dependent DNA helicase DinG [Chengkuizengella sp. 2205SS18-9]MDP5273840.1 ATP-dependent DNA helicase DinG [Chengkuizengella sp. 2205SS18-9]
MKFAVLDFETTGNQTHDRIIQVGLVIIENKTITDHFTSFVNPDTKIPSFITELTGISNDMVENAPIIDEVISQFQPLLENSILVAHHAAFDYGLLQKALEETGYTPFNGKVLDTIDLLRLLYPDMASLQLSMVSDTMGIDHDRPHQADSDALATAHILLQCIDRFSNLPLLTVQRIAQIFEPITDDLAWFIHELKEQLELETSLDINSHKYFRQFALNVNDWADESDSNLNQSEPVYINPSFEQFLDEMKHALNEQFESYKERPAQEQMIHEIHESFEKDQHLMIEASTGTGKSLGYLIPSLYYGLMNHETIVVSTHTINLQTQLMERDIPLLNNIFPAHFRAAVLKGRSHYLCLRKFENKVNIKDIADTRDDRITAGQMIVWLSETSHGDEDEISFGNKGREFWTDVASDADSCLNRACPWFKKCFYHRARYQANQADVVITNHSMIMTDVIAENRLLPSYDHLVIDEAHHFESVASHHLGRNLTYFSLIRVLTRLYKDSHNGLLPQLRFQLEQMDEIDGSLFVGKIGTTNERLVQVKEEWDILSALFYDVMMNKRNISSMDGGQLVLRLKTKELPDIWGSIETTEQNLYLELNEILKTCNEILTILKEFQDEYDLQSLSTDLSGVMKDLFQFRDNLRLFVQLNDENEVYWIEANAHFKQKSIHLKRVPIDVSEMLKQSFFEVKNSIIMTSATMSVNESFQHLLEQIGLEEDLNDGRLRTVQLPTAFNYREQSLICIPRDFPAIRGAEGDEHFIQSVTDSLIDVAIQTQGRMLILFTSYRMLKLVYEKIKEVLKPQGFQVLGQGVDSGNRSKLTRMFQNNDKSILLGASSFWEGVDIPGHALSCLAIIRLPFQPPNDPIVEAKCDYIKEKKQNPFMKYSVPQAVIKFKQGFGRLIRTEEDKGVVIIYDTRVIHTRYGKHFLYSLPKPKIEHMKSEQMVTRIGEWFVD